MGDIKFDSDAEMHFSWWLEELKVNGYIKEYYFHHTKFDLSESVHYLELQRKNRVDKMVERTLIQPQTYSSDFTVEWNDVAINKFIVSLPVVGHKLNSFIFVAQDLVSIIDVKGSVLSKFTRNYNSHATFPIKRAWVYQKYNVFVNTASIPDLFIHTFTPERYKLTNVRQDARNIKFKVKTLNEFINERADR